MPLPICPTSNPASMLVLPPIADRRGASHNCCFQVPMRDYLSPAGESVGVPSFLRRKNGQLLMAYIWSVGGRDPYGHSYYRCSDDEGATWSDPKVLTPSRERICQVHNDKLLRLSSDRILAAAELRIDGHTWHRSDNDVDMLTQGVESQEPHLVELRDGRVMMLFRTYSGYVGRAHSEDQGQTWSEGEIVEDLQLPINSSALHVSRIPSTGNLLLVRSTGNGGKVPGERPRVFNRGDGNKHYIRTPFTSIISRDEGETWENEQIIAGDPYGDFGYPSVLHLDNLALVSYHALDVLHLDNLALLVRTLNLDVPITRYRSPLSILFDLSYFISIILRVSTRPRACRRMR
jgi:hypothetical protein